MFTGIIKKVSQVEKALEKNGSFFVTIKKPVGWKIKLGDSIAINGVCSTVKKLNKKSFEVEYMPETLKKTTVGQFQKGRVVNLERSLMLSDLLDGHLVQGHVDTRGKIISIQKAGESKIVKVKLAKKFRPFIVEKGSVSIDGISLTVVDTGADWFSVSLVDYTLKNTNLGEIKVGEAVNIETDILGKYIYNFLKKK